MNENKLKLQEIPNKSKIRSLNTETQKIINNFQEQEKHGERFDIPKESVETIIQKTTKALEKKVFFDIGEYIIQFEKEKIHKCSQRDIEQIIDEAFIGIDRLFEEQKNILKHLQDEKEYENQLTNKYIIKDIKMFVMSKKVKTSIKTLVYLFNTYLIEGKNRIWNHREKNKKTLQRYIEHLANLIALTGNLKTYEGFKKNRKSYIENDAWNYDTIKKINIFTGNEKNAYIASYEDKANHFYELIDEDILFQNSQGDSKDRKIERSGLSEKELEILGHNIEENKEKRELIPTIQAIMDEINTLIGEEKYIIQDYEISDDAEKWGRRGKRLYTTSLEGLSQQKELLAEDLKWIKKLRN